MLYFVWVSLVLQIASFANSGDATVVLLRGTAKDQSGKALQLKDKVRQGSQIQTSARSFVKLLFSDNTQLSVGPDTTLKIEPAKAGDPSLVNLVGGQIRAKVTKDFIGNKENAANPGKEKMVIKTKTAAMGIRGTDFSVSYNQLNQMTALVTFEGNVAMAKLDNPNIDPMRALNLPNVQSVRDGQFSGAQPDLPNASIPVKISPAQLESMKTNESFSTAPQTAKSAAMASPIPPGVDPKAFVSSADRSIKASMNNMVGEARVNAMNAPQTNAARQPPPEGFFDPNTKTYAPRAGGFVDLASGRYVPPPPGSSFDPNTGVFVPPKAVGQFDPATGTYVPPKGVVLDPVKGFIAEPVSQSGPRPASGANSAAQGQAIAAVLNANMNPANAGQSVTFEKTFSPNANQGAGFLPPPPPPPPGSLPPPNGNQLPPPPDQPVDNPFCPTCINDNVNQNPVDTRVRFQINLQ
ncbi:MAG: FecR family protein [Oligoflexia bacterium]|nr:FecR family protein [Oligoflexia bacterium]